MRLEQLEPRLLRYHGPTVLPGPSLEVTLDETLDQFGFQPPTFQAYRNQNDPNGTDLVGFSIFDTGASVVTVSASDQFFFQFFDEVGSAQSGIPILNRCGASAEGVGGTLTGHVSMPGVISADGLHISSLTFDNFGFPVFEIEFDPATAAIVEDVQVFVGALIGDVDDGGCPPPASEVLPTISGTPMLNPSQTHPNGLAVNIRPQGELLDFSDFPELQGLVLPVPDVRFQEPGLDLPEDPMCEQMNQDGSIRDVCTEPVHIAMDLVGIDNHHNEGDSITESYNPVQSQVEVVHGSAVLSNQVYLFDTGAQLSIISTPAAEALGLDLDHPTTTISVQGAAGAVHDIPGFTIDRLSMPLVGGGTLTFKNVPIYVLDVAPGLLDGILGMNLFNHASSMLYDPHHPDGAVLSLSFFTEHLFGIFGSAVPESEPNDTAGTATLLGPGQYGVGAIQPAGDIDYWVVSDTAAGDLVFAYVDTQNSESSPDSTLRVFANDTTTEMEFDDNDGPGFSSVIAGAVVTEPGDVFFRVEAANGVAISQYELYQAVVPSSNSANELEGNNSLATATPLTRAVQRGSVQPGSGDVDYFSFVATRGSRIIVIMDNDPDRAGGFAHTDLAILDPNGEVLQIGDNTGVNGNAAGAVLDAPASGIYYVRVADGGSGTDNDYQFVVVVVEADDALAGAVLSFSSFAAQTRAERAVTDCLENIFFCDLDLLLGSLDFLGGQLPMLAFAGAIGGGNLASGFNNVNLINPARAFAEANRLIEDCLLDLSCDIFGLLGEIEALLAELLGSGDSSLQMIQGGILPGFSSEGATSPFVTLDVPPLTNDSTPSMTVRARASGGLSDGTLVRVDVDLSGDGDFDDSGESSYQTSTLQAGQAQFDVSPSLGEGAHAIRARVSNASGAEGSSETAALVIDLTPPSLTNMPADQTVPATSAAGAVVIFTPPGAVDAIDPSPAVSCTAQSGSLFPVGETVVGCTATDEAGNSRSQSFTVRVTGQAQAFDFKSGVLTVTGTEQDDVIRLVMSGRGLRVETTFGNYDIASRRALSRVVIHAGDGNDVIDLKLLSSKQNALIDAGAGDDSVISGSGSDLLLGGLGRDQLDGFGGNDILVGGEERDSLLGGKGSDLLIGASLSGASESDMAALSLAWQKARKPAAKRLTIEPLIDSLLDDLAADDLAGGKHIDFFLMNPLDVTGDRRSEDVVI